MQNLYTYTKFFQPPYKYDERFTIKMENAILTLHKTFSEKPLDNSTKVSYLDFTLPYLRTYKDEYNDIIRAFAKFLKVKVMYKDYLSRPSLQLIKGLKFIGEPNRVSIFNHIVSHYFRGMFNYEQYIRTQLKDESFGHGFNDVRLYSSKILFEQREELCIYVNGLLDDDKKYTYWLEMHILEEFKLDFKKYLTDKPTYDHAVSKVYHDKRMML